MTHPTDHVKPRRALERQHEDVRKSEPVATAFDRAAVEAAWTSWVHDPDSEPPPTPRCAAEFVPEIVATKSRCRRVSVADVRVTGPLMRNKNVLDNS